MSHFNSKTSQPFYLKAPCSAEKNKPKHSVLSEGLWTRRNCVSQLEEEKMCCLLLKCCMWSSYWPDAGVVQNFSDSLISHAKGWPEAFIFYLCTITSKDFGFCCARHHSSMEEMCKMLFSRLCFLLFQIMIHW